VNHNNVDIVDWDREASASEGNLNAFNDLMSFLSSTNLATNEGYDALKQYINFDSFIPYVATHLYFANEDFPNNNVRMWRERSHGKKWSFFFYDCDGCMRNAEMNSFERFTETRNDGNPVSIMLSGLLKNQTFRNELLTFLTSRMNREFSPEHVLTHIENLEAKYSPLMVDHIGRWNTPDDMHEWNTAVSQLRQFAINRPIAFGKHLQEYFKKPYKTYPIPANTSLTLAFEVEPDEEIIAVLLQDMTGRSFKPEQLRFTENSLILDTENIPNGVYLLNINFGSSFFSEKIVISH
jgi:spore coat protein CotH